MGRQKPIATSQLNPWGHSDDIEHVGMHVRSVGRSRATHRIGTPAPPQSISLLHGAHTSGANETQTPRPRSQIGVGPPHPPVSLQAMQIPARQNGVGAMHIAAVQASGGGASGMPPSEAPATHTPAALHVSRGPHGLLAEQRA